MGKRSENKRDVVRRAAATGGAADTMQRQSTHRFLALVAAVIMAGTLVVGFAYQSRQYDHPTLFDSWQNAYGVFDCTTENWLEPFDSRENPNGIRSRGDGVIYIEPTVEEATGDGARLDVFLTNVGARLNDAGLRLPDGSELAEHGAFCSNEEAVLQVQRWDTIGDEPVEVRYDNFDDVVFLEDGQSFTIALAPVGASIPKPPGAELLPDPLPRPAAVPAGGEGS